MISYSQNFEDVILARALSDVEAGFYVDLGASHSSIGSITKHFYDQGWSGINVEPNPSTFESLVSDRPRDINLNVGISALAGSSVFYCITENQLSTFDPVLGEVYLKEFPGSTSMDIETVTTESLVGRIRTMGTEVHFLKIDIEGKEADVVNSWNFSELSPWVVVVESTIPRTRIPTHQQWEATLIEAGYGLVYRDGLNRFYLHSQKQELEHHFDYPPNVFDEFISSSELDAINERDRLLVENRSLTNSLSWKMTAPLRALARRLN